MVEVKGKKNGKQELGSLVTFSDAKGNKIMVSGSINGFAVRHVDNPKTLRGRQLRVSGHIRNLDDSWKSKKVLVILLEK